MSQETYTFACPVCAVRLSVPQALAGVRGPCPQCHHEITAPEPESVLAPAMAGVGGAGAPPLPPPPPAMATPSHPAGPPIPASDPLPVPPLEAVPVGPSPLEIPAVEPSSEGSKADVFEDEEVFDDVPPAPAASGWPAPPPRARRSPSGLAVAALLLIALLAAAALNFLPRQSLRRWLGRVLPSQAVEAVVGPASPRPSSPEAGAATSTPDSSPSPTAKSAEPSTVQIRPALDPEEAPASPALEASAQGPADPPPNDPADPAGLAAANPSSAIPSTVEGSPNSTTPDAPAPDPPAPTTPHSPEPPEASSAPAAAATPAPPASASPQEGGAPPSLLPDISQGASAAPAAVNEAMAGAQEALTLFLQARNWQDRMALCEGGESLRREMESYYGKAQDGPNTPTSVEHIASAPLPDGTRTVQVFHVTFPDLPQGFPVPVRQTEEGWKIDWRAFVEFKEGRLKKFLASYQDTTEVFRVRLQRSHQADRAVPNADKKYTFRIAAPIEGHEGFVYAEKDDSIVGPKIAKKLDANAIHLVMAKLKWVRGTNGRAHVELRDIVSESWREAP